MKFSDFYEYEQIKTNKGSEGIGLHHINSDILGIIRKSVQILAEKKQQTGQNSILAEIFGDFRRCRFTLISSDGSGVSFHWG